MKYNKLTPIESIPLQEEPIIQQEQQKPEILQEESPGVLGSIGQYVNKNIIEPATNTISQHVKQTAEKISGIPGQFSEHAKGIQRDIGGALTKTAQGAIEAHGGLAEVGLGLGNKFISKSIPTYKQVQEKHPWLKYVAPTPAQAKEFHKYLTGGKFDPTTPGGQVLDSVFETFGNIAGNIGSVLSGAPHVARAAMGAIAGKSGRHFLKSAGFSETSQDIADIGLTWLAGMPNGIKDFEALEGPAWEAVKNATEKTRPALFARAQDITNGITQMSDFNKFMQNNFSFSGLIKDNGLKLLFLGPSAITAGVKNTAIGATAAVALKNITRAAEIIMNSSVGRREFGKLFASAGVGQLANADNLSSVKKINNIVENKINPKKENRFNYTKLQPEAA